VPVILVQRGNPRSIRSLEDLTRDGMKVALGDATSCAIGRATATILERHDIAAERIEPNVVFRAPTVNELGNHVKLGTVDAAIVWDAVAAMFAESADVVPIATERNVVSTVQAGVLRCARHGDLATQLVDYLAGPDGRRVFAEHHYTVTPPSNALD